MEKTVFIDFNGLPGSGKTTICSLVMTYLEQKGYPVLFLQKEIITLSKKKYLMPFLILKEMLAGAANLVHSYTKLFFTLEGMKAEGFKQTFAALKNCMLARRIERNCDEPFVITDQCIVQNLLSCVYNHPGYDLEAAENLLSECIRQLRPIIFVNINTDVDTAYARMTTRQKKNGRLDHLSGDKLHDALSTQNELLLEIRKWEKNVITVDSSFPAEESAKLIVAEVLKRCEEISE